MKLAASNVDLREEGAGVTVAFVPGTLVVLAAEVTGVVDTGASVVVLVMFGAAVGWAVVTGPVVVLEDAVVALEGDSVVVLEGSVVVLEKGTGVGGKHCFSSVHPLYASELASVPFIHVCESLHLIHPQPVLLPIHELHVVIFPQMSTPTKEAWQ